MKILQVVAGLEQGGIERGTVEVDHFITAKGAQSFVASAGGRLVTSLTGTHFTLPLTKKNPWHLLYCAWQLSQIIAEHKIDIVVARSRFPCHAAKFATRWQNVPLVTVFHGTHKIQNALKKWYNASVTKGDRVIAVSDFIKDHLIQHYSVAKARLDVAKRGVDVQNFNPARFTADHLEKLKQHHDIPTGVPLLNLSGRISPWKGQSLFIDLLAQIQDLPWHALMIGGASQGSDLQAQLQAKITQLDLSDRISFLGLQSDLAPFYLMSDLAFSLSTEPEAFGRVAIEAQAMGTPIFATAIGGSLETVMPNETGFLVAPDDPENMAKILRNALENPEKLQQMGDKARQHVHTHFTIDKMCDAEWRSYEMALKK